MPGRTHHMVTSLQHLEDINEAPLDVLSPHAVAKDVRGLSAMSISNC
jgi:hypothetical protein